MLVLQYQIPHKDGRKNPVRRSAPFTAHQLAHLNTRGNFPTPSFGADVEVA
jgi:hypothetical protein